MRHFCVHEASLVVTFKCLSELFHWNMQCFWLIFNIEFSCTYAFFPSVAPSPPQRIYPFVQCLSESACCALWIHVGKLRLNKAAGVSLGSAYLAHDVGNLQPSRTSGDQWNSIYLAGAETDKMLPKWNLSTTGAYFSCSTLLRGVSHLAGNITSYGFLNRAGQSLKSRTECGFEHIFQSPEKYLSEMGTVPAEPESLAASIISTNLIHSLMVETEQGGN